jgi:hypothetical protein
MKAFPQNEATMHIDLPLETQQGMDLRDYFAAKAMAAIIIASDKASNDVNEIENWLANYAYHCADLMMEKREE